MNLSSLSGIKPGKWINSLNYETFNEYIGDEAKTFLDSLKNSFRIKRKISHTTGLII